MVYGHHFIQNALWEGTIQRKRLRTNDEDNHLERTNFPRYRQDQPVRHQKHQRLTINQKINQKDD